MTQLGRKMWGAKMLRKGSWRCHELKDCAIIEMLEGDPGPYEFIVFTPDELKQHEEALLREGWEACASESSCHYYIHPSITFDDFLKSRGKE